MYDAHIYAYEDHRKAQRRMKESRAAIGGR